MSNILNENELPEKKPIGPRGKDFTNQRIGRLQALYCCGTMRNEPGLWWVCKCDCGNYLMVRSSHLSKGQINSCGCQRRSQELIGKRFGKLVVLERAGTASDRSALWLCECDCGARAIIRGRSLKNGDTKSCGCIKTTGEWEVQQTLSKYGVNFIKEYSFEELKDKAKLRFDFAIFDSLGKLACLIEFQGEQHFDKNSPFYTEALALHDSMKREYCDKNNIPLYYVTKQQNIEEEVSKILLKNLMR